MYDYKYGRSTKHLRREPMQVLGRLRVQESPSPVMGHVFEFLPGYLLLQLSSHLGRQWYSTLMQFRLWKSQSHSLGPANALLPLYDHLSIQVRAHQLQQASLHVSDQHCIVISGLGFKDEEAETATWLLVYWNLLFKTCVNCAGKSKLRFTQLLQRVLCKQCSRKEEYAMVGHKAASKDFGVSKQDLNRYKVEGLRISNPDRPGKTLFVYYKAEIRRIQAKKATDPLPPPLPTPSLPSASTDIPPSDIPKPPKHHKSHSKPKQDRPKVEKPPPVPKPPKPPKPTITPAELEEIKLAQKRELIHAALSQLNITDQEFINELFTSEYNWVAQYYSGRIRISPSRMIIRVETHYKKWCMTRSGWAPSRRRPRYIEALKCLKVPKTETTKVIAAITSAPKPDKKRPLTEEDKAQRRTELLDRLLRMGVQPGQANLEDPEDVGYKYINGIGSEEIGPVAGAIWRKNKPTFTGITLKTCQREEDLGKFYPENEG
jgi:hypothetical protein